MVTTLNIEVCIIDNLIQIIQGSNRMSPFFAHKLGHVYDWTLVSRSIERFYNVTRNPVTLIYIHINSLKSARSLAPWSFVYTQVFPVRGLTCFWSPRGNHNLLTFRRCTLESYQRPTEPFRSTPPSYTTLRDSYGVSSILYRSWDPTPVATSCLLQSSGCHKLDDTRATRLCSCLMMGLNSCGGRGSE